MWSRRSYWLIHRPSDWQQSEGIFMLSCRLRYIFHTAHIHNSCSSYLYTCIPVYICLALILLFFLIQLLCLRFFRLLIFLRDFRSRLDMCWERYFREVTFHIFKGSDKTFKFTEDVIALHLQSYVIDISTIFPST